jgi:hypothetical protein
MRQSHSRKEAAMATPKKTTQMQMHQDVKREPAKLSGASSRFAHLEGADLSAFHERVRATEASSAAEQGTEKREDNKETDASARSVIDAMKAGTRKARH